MQQQEIHRAVVCLWSLKGNLGNGTLQLLIKSNAGFACRHSIFVLGVVKQTILLQML